MFRFLALVFWSVSKPVNKNYTYTSTYYHFVKHQLTTNLLWIFSDLQVLFYKEFRQPSLVYLKQQSPIILSKQTNLFLWTCNTVIVMSGSSVAALSLNSPTSSCTTPWAPFFSGHLREIFCKANQYTHSDSCSLLWGRATGSPPLISNFRSWNGH